MCVCVLCIRFRLIACLELDLPESFQRNQISEELSTISEQKITVSITN
jgi:hypothetical protein